VKPKDIFPCVEDPLKLTYLDPNGCFGDLCDLSNGSYMRKIGAVSSLSAEMALEKMLEERWRCDDISDDESDEEDADTESDVNPDKDLENRIAERGSIPNQPFETDTQPRNVVSIQTSGYVDVDADRTTDDGTDDDPDEIDETELVNESLIIGRPQESENLALLCSQQSAGVLFAENDIANDELVRLYFELASKGEPISLKCVEKQENIEL
jgi:hypothetical protein